MSSSPPVDDRAPGANAPRDGSVPSDAASLPGTDDLEALLGSNPAVLRSRERKAASEAVAQPEAAPPVPAPQQPPSAAPPPTVAPPPIPEQPIVQSEAAASAPPAPPKPRRTFSETIWAWAFPVLLILLALLIPVFGIMGANAILDSSDGDVAVPITDPSAPGYEVLVAPTPVTMMVLVEDGTLVGVNVTSLAGDDLGGTMLWVPPNTVVDGAELAVTYAEGGSSALRDAVATELTIDVGTLETLDDDRWASLVEPVAPVRVDLPDALISENPDGTTSVFLPSGPAALEPDQVGPYLAWLNPGERQINRLARQQDFYNAWLSQISASDDPGAVPGEVEAGLGRFIRGLSSGTAVTETLPVTPLPDATADLVEVTDDEAVRILVTEVVPLPVSPFPGVRLVVKLLDGVGDQPRTLAAIDDLVLSGAQISILGNDAEFGVAITEVRYHVPEVQAAADGLAEALGVEAASFVPTTSEGETVVIEVTVVIGADYEPAQAAE